MYCSYYQAYVVPTTGWFVVAVLKSYEHLSFDRTINVECSIFEFFVTPSAEETFLTIMAYMQEHGYVSDIKKLPNRLEYSDEL